MKILEKECEVGRDLACTKALICDFVLLERKVDSRLFMPSKICHMCVDPSSSLSFSPTLPLQVVLFPLQDGPNQSYKTNIRVNK